MKRRVLGKGLEALIPDVDVDDEATNLVEIDIDQIIPNRYQPRKSFDDAKLEELAASIREQGVLQPVVVCKVGSGYELIIGERRLRAAKKAGLTTIPAILKEASAEEMLAIALVENLQRDDLNPIEEAEAFQRLIEDFSLTQEDVAQKVGKDRSSVTNYLRLLKLPKPIQQGLVDEKISMGHARAIVGLKSQEEQLALYEKIIVRGLSVRQTENLVRDTKIETPSPPPPKSIYVRNIEEKLKQHFQTKVSILSKKGKGEIVIEYYSEEDLDRIYTKLFSV
jgi:ParB family chromosome partitioning protein